MTFAEILKEYSVPIAPEGHHHSRPGWTNFDCPFCGKDSHSFHMGFSLADKYCSCWKCGYHSLLSVLIELTELSIGKCRELLGDIRPEWKITERPRGKFTPPKRVGPLLDPHMDYLYGRGYDIQRLKRIWGIQGIGHSIRLAWRIFIPITYHGEVVSWTSRSISNQDGIVRYLSASPEEESVSHKTLLYGEDFAKHAIIVCEGPMDVWKIGPGAVATFGTAFSRDQVAKISRYSVRAICYDNERIAQQRAKRLTDMLSVYPGETINVVLDRKDPGEASSRELNMLRRLLR